MSNRTVAITGISGGIGQAMGNEFLKNGYQVIGFDLDDSKFEDLGQIDCFKLDVTNYDNSKEVFEKVLEKYSKIA